MELNSDNMRGVQGFCKCLHTVDGGSIEGKKHPYIVLLVHGIKTKIKLCPECHKILYEGGTVTACLYSRRNIYRQIHAKEPHGDVFFEVLVDSE